MIATSQDLQERQTDGRPWAQLAEWLRMAHSRLDAECNQAAPESKAIQHASEMAACEQQTQPAALGEKRKLRFVWDRQFIGLVYR
jgi:hypothetical protein